MKRGWKRILRRGGLVLAGLFLLLAVFSAFVYFHKPTLKAYLERTLSKRPGLTVTIGRLDYGLFPLRVEANSVRIGFVSALGRAQAFIERAAAPGSLGRVLKNQKPFFDTLTISGLKFEFFEDPDAPPTRFIDVGAAARTFSEYLQSVGRLVIRDSSLRLDLPVEGLDFKATAVGLEASGRDRTTIDLSVGSLEFVNARPGAVLTAALRARLGWGPSNPPDIEGDLDLTRASLSMPEKGWAGSSFDLKAGLHYGRDRVLLDRLRVEIPGLIALTGSGRVDMDPKPAWAFASQVEIEDIDRVKTEFAAFLPRNLPDISISGPAHWEGEVRREAVSGRPVFSLDGTFRMPPAHLMMKRNGLSVDLTLGADLRLAGSPAAIRVNGLAKGERGEVAANSFQIHGLSFNVPIALEGSRMTFSSFKARATEIVLNAGGPGRKLTGLAVAGGLKIDLPRRAAASDSLDLDLSRIGRFSLAGQASLAPRPNLALNLTSRALDIQDLLGAFRNVVPDAVAAWRPAGRADLSVEIRSDPTADRRYRVRGTIGLAGAGFQNPTGSIVSEGLEPRISFDADLRPPDRLVPFSFRLELAKGESLWKDLYLNWRDNPLRLDVKAELEPGAGSIRKAAAVLAIAPLGELRAEGSFSAVPALRFEARFSASSVDLARLRGFLGKAIPSKSAAWEIEGRADAVADARFGDFLKMRGTLKVRDGSLKRADGGLTLAGLSAEIPFSFSNGVGLRDKEDDYALVPGFLGVREVGTPTMPPAALRIDFLAARNLFLFLPFQFELWGAKLEAGPSVLALCPAVRSWRGVSRLALDGVDLAGLPIATETFKLAGRAWIPPNGLELRPGEIRFRGQVLADLFGGRMTLDDLRLTDPFSAGRRVMFQAEIAGLDLARLTSAVPFGDVTGIVDVSIRDFVLSYGQPESFSLSIQSVPRKGVSRKFSLKAVDNLSVISSGGQAAPPSASWLMKFISGFNYSRIGIACSLRNDVFTLQGTIVEGGVQYLVRRATFFGIDVVNAKPVNTIGFKDMIGRLERVGVDRPKK